MIKKSLILFTASILFFGCSSIKILQIKNNQKIEDQGIIFYLPQTAINITVETVKQNIIAGQFFEEAQNLLPVKPNANASKWIIKNISLTTIAEPDSSRCYLLKQSTKKIIPINLDNKNIIIGFNAQTTLLQQDNTINNPFPYPKTINYNDYFIKKNTISIIDTIYTVVKRDSSFYTKRTLTRKKVVKTKADYANDIYRYLIKVRKRKFRLIAGMDKTVNDPQTLKTQIHHLDSLEEKLKTLIIGNQVDLPYTYLFRFSPDANKLTDTIAFFSTTYGINQISGTPIIIKVIPLETHFTKFEYTAIKNGLPYCIPKQSIAQVFVGDKLISEQQLSIAQTGKIFTLPANILTNRNISILYDPLTGQIKKILNSK